MESFFCKPILLFRSLELPLLRWLDFSFDSGRLGSGDCSLCEDFEATRFEKRDLEGSLPCRARSLSGEGGKSGIAVIRGDAGLLWFSPLLIVSLAESGCMNECEPAL